MISYWERNSFTQKDIVIIGSGITGLSAAAYLSEQQPGRKITVFEKGLFPSGASTKNAGFACFGSLSEIIDDLLTLSTQEVFDLVTMRYQGLEKLKQRLGRDAIEFEQHGGYELISPQDVHYLEKIDFVNQLLSPLFGNNTFMLADDKIDPFGFNKSAVQHLIWTPLEGQIDTGSMMESLLSYCRKKGVEIFTNTSIEYLDERGRDVLLRTADGINFHAQKVLVATNGFVKKLLKSIPVNPGRGLVIVTEPISGLKIKGTFHLEKGFYYFRNIENRVLLGGGRNLDIAGETTFEEGINELILSKLKSLLHEVILPSYSSEEIKIADRWSGIMGFGDTKKTNIAQYSQNVYVAAGLGGMGVAIGSIIGEKLAKMIM